MHGCRSEDHSAQSQRDAHCLMVLGVCRAGLKAELGAFYPLLLLRPMEAERPEPGQLHSALSSLQDLSSQPQLLVRAPHRSLSLPLCTSGRACVTRQHLQGCLRCAVICRQAGEKGLCRRYCQACHLKGTCSGVQNLTWCCLMMYR